MGTCNEALLSYGIVIPQPKAIALLNALRKIPLPPGKSTEWDTDELDPDDWGYEDGDEIDDRIKMQLGVEEMPFKLQVMGSSDREWDGVAILFNGEYEGKDKGSSNGLTVDFWGTDGAFPSRCFVIRECITLTVFSITSQSSYRAHRSQAMGRSRVHPLCQ